MSDTVRVPREPTKEMCDEFYNHDTPIEDVDCFEGFKRGYHAMLSAAPQSSDGWIPVGERLPDTKTLVIAHTKEYGPLLADRSTSNSQHGWSCDGHITHWMPLPSPPEKDKP